MTDRFYSFIHTITGKYLTIPRTEGISTTHIVGRILDHISYSNSRSSSSSSAGSSGEMQTHLQPSEACETTDPGSESGPRSESGPGSVFSSNFSPSSGIRNVGPKEETGIGRGIETKKDNGTGTGRRTGRNQERAFSALLNGKSNFSTTGSKLRLFSENVQVNT